MYKVSRIKIFSLIQKFNAPFGRKCYSNGWLFCSICRRFIYRSEAVQIGNAFYCPRCKKRLRMKTKKSKRLISPPMHCPRCGKRLWKHESSYAYVYVCERCGIVILDFKLKLPKSPGERLEEGPSTRPCPRSAVFPRPPAPKEAIKIGS
jgi:predicted RNA-binding Zn-ribbon protein involved in translation (DUF1610 family)